LVAVADPRQPESNHVEMKASSESETCVGVGDVNSGGLQEVVIETSDEIGESAKLVFGGFGVGVGGGELREDSREMQSVMIDDAVDDGNGLFACHSASAHAGIDFHMEGECAAERFGNSGKLGEMFEIVDGTVEAAGEERAVQAIVAIEMAQRHEEENVSIDARFDEFSRLSGGVDGEHVHAETAEAGGDGHGPEAVCIGFDDGAQSNFGADGLPNDADVVGESVEVDFKMTG